MENPLLFSWKDISAGSRCRKTSGLGLVQAEAPVRTGAYQAKYVYKHFPDNPPCAALPPGHKKSGAAPGPSS